MIVKITSSIAMISKPFSRLEIIGIYTIIT